MAKMKCRGSCYNVCRDCVEDCEFNKDEQFVDTDLGGTWIRIGNEFGLYDKDGICRGTVEANNFRIRQLRLRKALAELISEIKKAFLNDVRKIKEFYKKWTR